MKWATRALIHFDRVASAWLILRFVDPEAEFQFLADGEHACSGVTPFGVPGVLLAAHDGGATTFQRILEAYALRAPALTALGALVADVVAHVMNDRDGSALARRHPLAGGMLAVAEGAMLLSASDEECLARSIPIYDALHARLMAQLAIDRALPSPPASVLDQTVRVARATDRLRRAQARLSDAALAEALRPP